LSAYSALIGGRLRDVTHWVLSIDTLYAVSGLSTSVVQYCMR